MRLMRIRLFSFALVLGLLAALTAPLAANAAPPTTGSNLTAPITGTFTSTGSGALGSTFANTASNPGTFNGTFTLQRFTTQNGALAAVGTLAGTVTGVNAAGAPVSQTVNQQVTVPVQATGTCSILDLTLGPLHLDLLGLVIDLNQVHLTINAQQGPGNLLGNLLCGIANLLNGNAPAGSLADLLNQLLALL